MISAVIIIGIVVLVLFCCVLILKEYFLICPLTVCSIIFGTTLYGYWLEDTPSALDVYRGKTTLEITSVNGVPKDSVVVFKSK